MRCRLRDRIIIFDIRLPRVILGVLIGAALAVSGAVMQGLFRNPLADPGLVGVSAGAGLGAVVDHRARRHRRWRRSPALLGIYALPLAAFGGGLVTTLHALPHRHAAAARPRSPPCCSPASRSARWPAR